MGVESEQQTSQSSGKGKRRLDNTSAVMFVLMASIGVFGTYDEYNDRQALTENRDSHITTLTKEFTESCAWKAVNDQVRKKLKETAGPQTIILEYNRDAPDVQKCAKNAARESFNAAYDKRTLRMTGISFITLMGFIGIGFVGFDSYRARKESKATSPSPSA